MITDDIIRLDQLADIVKELEKSENVQYINIEFAGTPEFVDAAQMLFQPQLDELEGE